MLILILQDGCIKEKTQFLRLISIDDIKIGTVLKVPPTIPQFRIIYHHYIMFYGMDEDGFKYLHLRKNIFKKEAEVVNVPFEEIEKFLKYGVVIYWNVSYDLLDYEGIERRINSMMKKPIPYGLKNKICFNCETFLCFILLGIRTQSSEIAKIEGKYGKIGSFCILCLDKLIIITNSIGEMHYLMQNDRKE